MTVTVCCWLSSVMMMTIDALPTTKTTTSSRLITTLSSVTGPLHVLPNSDDNNSGKDQQQPSKSTSTTHTSSSSRREYGQNNRRDDTDTPSFNNNNLGRANNSMSSILHQFLEGASSNKNNKNKKNNIIELPSIDIDDLLSSVQLPKNNMMNDMLSSIISKLNSKNINNIIPTIPNKHDDNNKNKKKYENVNDFDIDLARDIEDALNLANKLTNDRGLGDVSILSPSTKTTTTSSHHISRGGEDEKNSISDTNSVQQKEKRTTTMFQEVNAAAAQGVNKNNHNKVRVETKKKERRMTPRPSTMFEQTNLASVVQSEQPKQTTNKFNKPNSNTSAADNIIMMESYMNVADVKQHTVSMGKQQQQRQWQQKQMDDASVNFFSTDPPRRRSSLQDYVNDANVKKYTRSRDIVNKEAQVVDKRREQRVNDNTSLMDNMGRGGGMFFATNSARVGRRTKTGDSAARDDHVYSSTTEPSLSSSPSQQQPRMQERNEDAHDAAYKRYNEYFESVGGSNNNMDYHIPAARVNIHGSSSNNDDPSTKRKIFITEQADELARFLRLDVNEIFQYKRRELDLHEDGTTTATAGMVNEDDVRDYLDKRYEQLFSMVSMNDEDIEPFDSSMTRRRNSMYAKRDDDYQYQRSNEDANGWRQSSSRRRVPRRGHDSLHPPHPLSVPLSQLVSSPRRSERFREQQHVTQYPLEELHNGSHFFRQEMQNQQQRNVVRSQMNFQDPYQERSRSMDDIRRREPDDRYSSQHSSRYYGSDEEYNSYFAPNTRNEPY